MYLDAASNDLHTLLELCDRLERYRSANERASTQAQKRRLTAQKIRAREKLRPLATRLLPNLLSLPVSSPFTWPSFDGPSHVLAAILLHRRLTHAEPTMLGRDLLWTIHDTHLSTLAGLPRVMDEAPLLRSGLVTATNDLVPVNDDVLHRTFALSPAVLHDVARRLADGVTLAHVQIEPAPWVDSVDVFMDWHDLTALCARRAARLFADSAWRDELGEPLESLERIQDRIDEQRRRIDARRAASPGGLKLALPAFEREFGLEESDMIILSALLWEEAVHGNPCLAAADLLRLLAATPREMLRRRRLFLPSSALIRHGIIEFDDMFAEKSSTAQVFVSTWASTRLLDAHMPLDRAIAADEKIDFHGYLSRLRGSAEFFDKLG